MPQHLWHPLAKRGEARPMALSACGSRKSCPQIAGGRDAGRSAAMIIETPKDNWLRRPGREGVKAGENLEPPDDESRKNSP